MQIQPYEIRKIRTAQQIFLEDLICTLVIYLIFMSFVQNYIPFSVLFLSVFIYVIRVFTIRHERSLTHFKKEDKIYDFLSYFVTIHHTFYQESYLDKKQRHLLHHSSHNQSENIQRSAQDAHSFLEVGTWYSTLFYCLFYEETMLFADLIHSKKLSSNRLISMAISSVLILATIYFSNIYAFLALFICYRVAGGLVWYFFSYILHHQKIIKSNFFSQLALKSPKKIHQMTEFILGQSHVTVVFFHAFHHKKPNEFYKF